MNMQDPFLNKVLKASKGEIAKGPVNIGQPALKKSKMESTMKKSSGVCNVDYSKVYEKIGSGQFGSVFDIGNGQVAKVESCHRNNSQFPNKTGGFEAEIKQIRSMTKVLEEAGYTPRIIKYGSCGSNCVTIMEKVEGGKSVKQAIVDRPEQAPELIETICKMVQWCHEKWAESGLKSSEGNPVGHGDLHLGNVLLDIRDMKLKFIDFSFSRKLDQKYDWIFMFEHVAEQIANNNNLKPYKQQLMSLIKQYVPESNQAEVKERFLEKFSR